MKCQQRLIPLLLAAILIADGNSFGSKLVRAPRQDEPVVTENEREQVRKFSKSYVERLLKTRNVAPLLKEFFLSDFTSFSKQDYYEKVSPELYAKLGPKERERLFVAQENLGYIITLDVMTNPNPGDNSDHPFRRILPYRIAKELNRSRLVEGTATFTNRGELLKEVNELEKTLLKASPFLKRRNLEHSSTFLEKIRRFEQDPALGYRIRASMIDEDLKRESGLARFAGQKVFSVDTPILIGLIVVSEGVRLRILTMVPADGD